MIALAAFLAYLLATICAWCAVFAQPVFGHPGLALGVAFIAVGLTLSALPAVRVTRTSP